MSWEGKNASLPWMPLPRVATGDLLGRWLEECLLAVPPYGVAGCSKQINGRAGTTAWRAAAENVHQRIRGPAQFGLATFRGDIEGC